ncbi:hypothetical protein LSAT2_021941 [Lamellibrachia satsuma]|nr:hypothetical protein LSAT2_021941 [Lamellibrachia satsuma]
MYRHNVLNKFVGMMLFSMAKDWLALVILELTSESPSVAILLPSDLSEGEDVINAAFPFSETSLFLADDVLSCS